MNAPTWFNRPGTASNLRASDGTAKQCKTSADVITNRIFVLVGKSTRLSTSNNRNWPFCKSSVFYQQKLVI